MYDVIILGLGAMGSAAAYHLSSRKQRVLGIERFTPAHDLGSSHGDSRIIRQAYHEHPDYVPLARRSYELWERLERDSGRSFLSKTGGLMIGLPGSPIVEGALRSAKEHGLSFEMLNAREVKHRFPAFHLRSEEEAMFEAVAGFLRPETAIQTHLSMAADSGADLHFEESVKTWKAHPGGDGVTVTTTSGKYEAARLVIASGSWAPQLLAGLQVRFEVRRHVMCWFQAVGNPVAFRPEVCPIYIWDVDHQNVFYGFPATGGLEEGVKVAMHSGGIETAADAVDRQISNADVDELRHHLRRFLPDLNGPCLRASVCLYTMTPDEHFVLGLHPCFPQVSIAAGFSGHGFKFSSVVGEVLADLAISGVTRHSINFLSPTRFRS